MTVLSKTGRASAGSKLGYSAAGAADPESVYLGLGQSAWVKVAAISILFCLLFWPNLQRLWLKTNPITGEDNWKHAMFVPLLGLYYLYVNREQLAAARVKTAWTGLAIMLGGILLFGYAIWPLQNDWVKDLGMVVTLFGVVAFLCGWQVMKTAWFPIVFLICALPWPGLFYSRLAGPLQELAARVAVHLMNFVGINSGQYGTKIFVSGKDGAYHTLNVAEACAGLRSLMTFIAIAGAVAFLSYRPLWQKFIMVFSAIPIAIFCNTMRVTVQGVLARYASMQWAEGAAHGMVGLVMMIPAFFLILLVGWILQNILIDEVNDKSALRAGGTAARSSRAAGAGARLVVENVRRTTTTAAAAPDRVSAQAIAAARASAVRQPPLKATPPPAARAQGAARTVAVPKAPANQPTAPTHQTPGSAVPKSPAGPAAVPAAGHGVTRPSAAAAKPPGAAPAATGIASPPVRPAGAAGPAVPLRQKPPASPSTQQKRSSENEEPNP